MASLWSSDHSFNIWRYTIGHSRLLLKSTHNSGESLGIVFEGVEFVKLTRVLPRLSITQASASQAGEINEAGVRSIRPLLRLALRHDRGIGLVACSRLSVGVAIEGDDRSPFDLHPVHLNINA